jgi:hypothetical protein
MKAIYEVRFNGSHGEDLIAHLKKFERRLFCRLPDKNEESFFDYSPRV